MFDGKCAGTRVERRLIERPANGADGVWQRARVRFIDNSNGHRYAFLRRFGAGKPDVYIRGALFDTAEIEPRGGLMVEVLVNEKGPRHKPPGSKKRRCRPIATAVRLP